MSNVTSTPAGPRTTPRELGSLAMPAACPRCIWVKAKAPGLPFQIFPGIFNAIDQYSKNAVQQYFEEHGAVPPYIEQAFGKVKRRIDPPHYSKFSALDAATGLTLRGEADDIYELEVGGLLILDYKTAKVTEKQDELLPLYEAQLNGYAFIAEQTGMGKVAALGLVYMEPQTTQEDAKRLDNKLEGGFKMGFAATVKPVALKSELIPGLLQKFKDISEQVLPPPGHDGCKDCLALQNLVRVDAGRLSEIVKPERKKSTPKDKPQDKSVSREP